MQRSVSHGGLSTPALLCPQGPGGNHPEVQGALSCPLGSALTPQALHRLCRTCLAVAPKSSCPAGSLGPGAQVSASSQSSRLDCLNACGSCASPSPSPTWQGPPPHGDAAMTVSDSAKWQLPQGCGVLMATSAQNMASVRTSRKLGCLEPSYNPEVQTSSSDLGQQERAWRRLHFSLWMFPQPMCPHLVQTFPSS